jgi:hypothetical protein
LVARYLKVLIASAAALAVGVVFVTDAHALVRRPHHHYIARGGDVVVHTGRSYLDPGPSAEMDSENHYFSDSATYGQTGPAFTNSTAGQELLPDRFNPPGRAEPLFRF